MKDDLYDFSPCSVELADFQLEMLEPPREERRKSRRISSLREKSEQDLQQLRMAPQSKSGSPMAPNQAQRPMRKARASKERIDPGHGSKKSAKVASMMRECLQIANFRLRATSREISEKLSATLQNTRNPRNPSVWPAHMAMLQPAPAAIELDGFVPKRNSTTTALPVVWFDIKLVKIHAFNEQQRKVKSDMNHNDPEMLHLAFQTQWMKLDGSRHKLSRPRMKFVVSSGQWPSKGHVKFVPRSEKVVPVREKVASLRQSHCRPLWSLGSSYWIYWIPRYTMIYHEMIYPCVLLPMRTEQNDTDSKSDSIDSLVLVQHRGHESIQISAKPRMQINPK